MVILYDASLGQETVTITSTSSISGTYQARVSAIPGASQSGTFRLFNGQSPASIQSMVFLANVEAGGSPFASSGAFQFIIGASGNGYQVVGGPGVASSHGACTYAKTSQSAGTLVFTDSVTGQGYAQTLCWDTATSAAYVRAKHRNGGLPSGNAYCASDPPVDFVVAAQ